MSQEQLRDTIDKIFENITQQIPSFESSELDWRISEGNVACCIIDDAGNIYGKIWGDDKLRGRKFYDVAYRKASQVWITGYATGEYEKLVFCGEIDYHDFGIELPDLMGWQGGQQIMLADETRISCGFSGFKGVNDLGIVKQAAESAAREL